MCLFEVQNFISLAFNFIFIMISLGFLNYRLEILSNSL